MKFIYESFKTFPYPNQPITLLIRARKELVFGVVVGCNVVVNAALSLPHHHSVQPRLNLQDIKYVF